MRQKSEVSEARWFDLEEVWVETPVLRPRERLNILKTWLTVGL